jgi:bifunctional enzyme CysN/CysC
VNRPNLDFRGYCGTLTSGIVRPGDEVTVLPSGKSSKVKSIVTYEGEIEEAFPPMAVTLTLEDEIDISRGDILVHSNSVPETTNRFDAMVVWMSEEPLQKGRQYEVKLNTTRIAGGISNVHHHVDVNTLEQSQSATFGLNEIARCEITLERPVVADDYRDHHGTGSFIIVDRLTNATVAAGMIIEGSGQQVDLDSNITSESKITASDRVIRFGQNAAAAVITGGNTEQRQTLLYSLESVLFEQGRAVVAFTAEQLEGRADLSAQLLKAAGLIALLEADSPVADALEINLDTLQGETPVEQLAAALELLK